MPEVYRIIALSLVIAVLCYYLKSVDSQLFIPALVAGGAVILFYSAAYLSTVFGIFSELAEQTKIDSELLSCVFKITIICYLIEFACSLVEDFGIKSIADKLAVIGKIIVLCLSAPIFKGVFETVVSFLSLL